MNPVIQAFATCMGIALTAGALLTICAVTISGQDQDDT